MSRMRRVFFASAAIASSLVVTLVICEGLLRLFPVGMGLKAQPVSEADPIFRFEANRDVLYSIGWNMARANRVHVNNAGYVNTVDYDERADSPLVAVIGDSYVEALVVPPHESIAGRLADRAAGRGRVYSFAASGAPLSQYLIWAQHARQRYGARGGVFVVVGNDFDESLSKYSQGPGFHHFDSSHGSWTVTLTPHEPSPLREAVNRSALARYLVFNASVQTMAARWRYGLLEQAHASQGPAFVGNTEAEASPERVADSERVVDTFLDELARRTGWSGNDVLFVVDGLRLYDADERRRAEGSYFSVMRNYFVRAARSRGCGVIDMDPLFDARFAADGSHFEWPDDRHWNPLAHGMAADAVAAHPFFERLLSDE